MTCERLCGPQKQPCPSPWMCRIDCHWETAEVETPHDKAARHFWEPGQSLHIDSIAEPEHNEPWSWVDDLRDLFWPGVFLGLVAVVIGLAAATAWNLHRTGTFSFF